MTKSIKFFIGALLFSLPVFWGVNSLQNSLDSYLTAQIMKPLESMVSFELRKKPLPADGQVKTPAPEIEADAAISVKISPDGRQAILLDKNIKKPLPIASLTKLMTALIVMENPASFNFSEVITVSKEAASQGNTPKYGNLAAGEKYTLEKLMELMLVYSSNDGAFALSETIGENIFVAKMNEKARELGLNYTYFINPTGLDPRKTSHPAINELNHSTAQDLVKLIDYIFKKQPIIFEFTKEGYNTPVENGIFDLKLNEEQKLIGGKTGFTKNAKGSVLFIFQDTKKNIFVNIVLGAATEELRIQEMQKIINWLLP
ncbi:MAG: serine hydrolase [Parcubacteria group bacterium]